MVDVVRFKQIISAASANRGMAGVSPWGRPGLRWARGRGNSRPCRPPSPPQSPSSPARSSWQRSEASDSEGRWRDKHTKFNWKGSQKHSADAKMLKLRLVSDLQMMPAAGRHLLCTERQKWDTIRTEGHDNMAALIKSHWVWQACFYLSEESDNQGKTLIHRLTEFDVQSDRLQLVSLA